MWGISCSMYNLKHLKRGLQALLTLLSHTQSEVEFRLGSRSARGCAAELGLFLLPWHRRLAPSSICSFGTYSCNDYKQSLIKLTKESVCECVWGRLFGLLFCFSVCECERAPQMSSTAEVCKFVCELICMHLVDSVVAHCLMCLYCILSSFLLMCMHVCG